MEKPGRVDTGPGLDAEQSSYYFFIESAGMSFLIPSFFIMSAHMVSFFIMASSFFMPSFLDIAM
jgi:hypothetical protein